MAFLRRRLSREAVTLDEYRWILASGPDFLDQVAQFADETGLGIGVHPIDGAARIGDVELALARVIPT